MPRRALVGGVAGDRLGNEVDGEGVAKAVLDVLETFENEANALRFISGVFPVFFALTVNAGLCIP